MNFNQVIVCHFLNKFIQVIDFLDDNRKTLALEYKDV